MKNSILKTLVLVILLSSILITPIIAFGAGANGDLSTEPNKVHWYADAITDVTATNYTTTNFMTIIDSKTYPDNEGRYEIQHWGGQSGLFFRIPVGTDYPIKNGRLVVKFEQPDLWLPNKTYWHFNVDPLKPDWFIGSGYDLITNITLVPQVYTDQELVVKYPHMAANSMFCFTINGKLLDGVNAVGNIFKLGATFTADYRAVFVETVFEGTTEKPAVNLQLQKNGVNEGAAQVLDSSKKNVYWTHLDFHDDNRVDYKYTVNQVDPVGYELVSKTTTTEAYTDTIVLTYRAIAENTPVPTPAATPTVAPTVEPVNTVVPTITAPQTGDNANIALYAIIAICAFIISLSILKVRIKNK